MNNKHLSKKGFLLVEALGALVLLVIGMTVVLEAFSLAAHDARRSRSQAELARCAQASFIEHVAKLHLAAEGCREETFETYFYKQ